MLLGDDRCILNEQSSCPTPLFIVESKYSSTVDLNDPRYQIQTFDSNKITPTTTLLQLTKKPKQPKHQIKDSKLNNVNSISAFKLRGGEALSTTNFD